MRRDTRFHQTIASMIAVFLVGCSPTPAGLPDRVASQGPVSEAAALSPEEALVMRALATIGSAAREATGDGAGASAAQLAKGYQTQSVASGITATVRDGFYVGPYPTPAALPTTFKKRPVGGWLNANPKVWTLSKSHHTETFYTPDGDTKATPAVTRLVQRDGVTVSDVYVSPAVEAPLPAYFAEKLGLAAGRTSQQAEETYHTLVEGALTGKASGYRWAVSGAQGLEAWVQAFGVTTHDNKRVHRYKLYSDYQAVNNQTRPLRYAYGTYYEETRVGVAFNQTYDVATGAWTGEGTWTNASTGNTVSFTETIAADGTVTRVFTHSDGTETVQVFERYTADGSGGGEVKRNGKRLGQLQWSSDGRGEVRLKSATLPYVATRMPPGKS